MNKEDLIKLVADKIMTLINKKVVLFFSGGAVNLKEIFNILEEYKILNYKIVCTDNCKKVIPEEYFEKISAKEITCKKELTPAVKEADYIIVPIMTRNTLAKCYAGIQDNLVTLGIAEALMMDKNVIALEDSFSPENPINEKLGFTKNERYNRLILRNKEELMDLGVKFIKSSDLNGLMSLIMNLDFLKSNKDNGSQEKEVTYVKEPTKIEDKLVAECLEALGNENKNQIVQHKLAKGNEDVKILKGFITVQELVTLNNNKKKFIIDENATLTPLAKDYLYNNKMS